MESKKQKSNFTLPPEWSYVSADYDLLKFLGEGSFGQVLKAKNKQTGKTYAVKHINNIFRDEYHAKKVIREIQIMRNLAAMGQTNIFTTNLRDIIIPAKDTADLKSFSTVFLVMDYVQSDVRKVLTKSRPQQFDDSHVIIILYNILCATNYLHSANVIHRDLKPSNILIDADSMVKLCDFGLARTLPFPAHKSSNSLNNDPNIETSFQSGSTQSSQNKSEQEKTKIAENLLVDRPKRQKLSRTLTQHITTRWYRPPEIILNEAEYDSRVDIWAVGCVLAEVARSTDSYLQRGQMKSIHDLVLFPGNSCFPNSPCLEAQMIQTGQNIVSGDDQLVKIIEMLGSQDQKNTSFISHDNAINYLNTIQNGVKESKLVQNFSHTSSEVLDILKSLIQFNPYFRTNAKECLKHNIFDEIRAEELEQDAPFKIYLNVDQPDWNQDCQSYDKMCESMRKIILEEMKIVNNMKKSTIVKC